MIARLLYSALLYSIAPFALLRLVWRARKQPEYLRYIGERYGFYRTALPASSSPLIWLHAVSVGETRAAEPLIDAMLTTWPQHRLLLTHATPTGRAIGKTYVEHYPGRVTQTYLPYDLPGAVARFLDRHRPLVGLLMETEIWPNLIAAAKRRDMPIALINARLSKRSQHRYQRFSALTQPAFARLSCIGAQTPADAQRIESLAVRPVTVCGNLKFDVTPAAQLLQQGATWKQAFGNRPVWLMASTREGEESLLLDTLANIAIPDLLVLLVPRHPQRFDEVAALVRKRGLQLCRRSEALPTRTTQVWLGDSMGEMAAYYAAADLALIGGSLLAFGGQNLIEAAACGCPTLVGPHMFNFAQATKDALACGAAHQVVNAEEAVRTAALLLRDRQRLQSMRNAATAFSHAHRGATARYLILVQKILEIDSSQTVPHH